MIATCGEAPRKASPPGLRYFMACWVISAVCVLSAALGLALGAPKASVVMLASTGMTLVIVALVRTVKDLLP